MDPQSEQMAASAHDPQELAELSALADGTLDPARRAEVEARIAASPSLSELYASERRIVALLHEARAADRAPAALRARIEASRPSRARRIRLRAGYATALSAALAGAILAVVLLLPAGTSVSVSQAAALAVRGPVAPAPAPDHQAPAIKLAMTVGGVPFPNWASDFGWKAVGARTDKLGGREAVTVYYEWHGQVTIAYTILTSPVLPQPSAPVTVENGTSLRTLTVGGRAVVTWRRGNQTCVLSGVGVPVSKLWDLAAWREPGFSAAAYSGAAGTV